MNPVSAQERRWLGESASAGRFAYEGYTERRVVSCL